MYALLLTLHTLLYLPPSASFDSSNSALRISVLPHLFTLSRQVSRSRPRHFKGSAPLLLFSLILVPAKFQNFSSSTISILNLRDSIRNNSNRTGEIKFIKLITRQICCFCAFYRTVSNYAQTSDPPLFILLEFHDDPTFTPLHLSTFAVPDHRECLSLMFLPARRAKGQGRPLALPLFVPQPRLIDSSVPSLKHLWPELFFEPCAAGP